MKVNDPLDEVEKTLESLDNLQRAEVRGSFEKELMQKVSFLQKPAGVKWLRYSAAAMIVMALLNFGALMTGYSEVEVQSDQATEFVDNGFLYESMDYLEFE